jgi:O-antigen/teichoic acid export membrane protein
MSIESQAISGLKWTGAARFISQTFSWAVTLIVVRLLTPADYGVVAVSAVIISIFSTAAELGLGAALVQAPKLDREALARVAGLAMLLNIGLGAVVALGAPLAGLFFNEAVLPRVIQVSSLHFVLAAVSIVPQALAYRDMNFKWSATIELVSALITSVTTLLLALHGAGVWSLVVGSLVGTAVRSAMFMRGQNVWPVFRLGGVRRHVTYGGALAMSRLAWQVINQSDVLIAGRFLTPSAVGLYSVSLHLATLPMQRVMGIVNQVVFPAVARLQDDRPRLRERLLSGLRLLGFVSVPVMWGISSIAPELVELALGPTWQEAAYPLRVVSLLIPLRMVSGIVSTTVIGVGALDLWNTAINLVVLPICFLIGVRWGVNGLATAWAVALFTVLSMTIPRNCAKLEVPVRDVARTLRDPILAGAAMYLMVAVGRTFLNGTANGYKLPVLILIGAAVYLPCLSVLNRRMWTDVQRLYTAFRA